MVGNVISKKTIPVIKISYFCIVKKKEKFNYKFKATILTWRSDNIQIKFQAGYIRVK